MPIGLVVVLVFVIVQVLAGLIWTEYANRKYGKRTTVPPAQKGQS